MRLSLESWIFSCLSHHVDDDDDDLENCQISSGKSLVPHPIQCSKVERNVVSVWCEDFKSVFFFFRREPNDKVSQISKRARTRGGSTFLSVDLFLNALNTINLSVYEIVWPLLHFCMLSFSVCAETSRRFEAINYRSAAETLHLSRHCYR